MLRSCFVTSTAVALAICAAALATALAPRALAEGGEEAAVRAAADHYLKGHATGDPEEYRKVFHPDSKLFGVRDGSGKLLQIASPEWISKAPGKPADDEAQRKRRIVMVDVAGDMALVKIELDYPAIRFTDYLTMLKLDGEWKIVNKTYTGTSKPKPAS